MLRSLKELVGEFIQQNKLATELETKTIEDIWKQETGIAITKNTKITYYKNGVITVKTKTPVWRNELSLQKQEIIDKINGRLNKNKVKDIRFI